ncbi:WxPxxD family membrane protein [Anoxybacillus flavithermus]|uniref:WxPxxD family membrane protein n=2 Tax=Anoxybacillaceae TaxID=3120669 RepID=UPI0007D94FEF|nr:WxPxxD family membrane protein [Anoxybacillus flavithermus]OAO77970.1 membrane protein [Anoxybacillus flavithermus]
MKAKRAIIVIILWVFFSFVWFIQNRHFVFQSHLRLSFVETLLLMNSSAVGYSSIQAYALFYTIPFLVCLDHFFLSKPICFIVRFAKRRHLYVREFIEIVIVASVFSFMHTLVNVLWTSYFFSFEQLQEVNFFSIALCNGVLLSIFYTSVGLIHQCFKHLTRQLNVAFFLTLLLVGFWFFIEKLFIFTSWGPMKDLTMYTQWLENRWTIIEFLFAYIRQALLVFFLFFMYSFLYERKDFIS